MDDNDKYWREENNHIKISILFCNAGCSVHTSEYILKY